MCLNSKHSLLQSQVQIANRVVHVFTSRGWRLFDGLRYFLYLRDGFVYWDLNMHAFVKQQR